MPATAPVDIVQHIQKQVVEGIKALYGADIEPDAVNLSPTRKEFEGDYTVTTFPFARIARKKPDAIGEELGAWLSEAVEEVERFSVIKGFLNLTLSDAFWVDALQVMDGQDAFGHQPPSGEKVMVEFSSPNTNKPLHLGHIRNILLGWSISRILEAAGHEVVKVQVVNDRGIAICKSMLAWQLFGDGETPASSGTKGDHFVGQFYVLFEKKFTEEYQDWQQTDEAGKIFEKKRLTDQDRAAFFKSFRNAYFNEYSPLGRQAKNMLRRWEADDPDTVALWRQMNEWVYEGFEATYRALGVSFDRLYHESETYLLGKDLIDFGLREGIFYQRDDGSVWADLTDAKLDEKLVLRSDGTSVYITQDLGTAHQRYLDFGVDRMVYVVADEQNYHFEVLFELLKRLEEPYAEGLHHLSYGMVDLPGGRMKSREGTVVDADDLIAEVEAEARANSGERGNLAVLTEEEQATIVRQVGLAALKFHIIKVQPRKRMTFDPKESVELKGQTGPYIQFAFVRTQGVLRKAGDWASQDAAPYRELQPAERDLVKLLYDFPQQVLGAAREFDPSALANYNYALAKEFHRFLEEHQILRAETESARKFRLHLVRTLGKVLKKGMNLLGIDMPERM